LARDWTLADLRLEGEQTRLPPNRELGTRLGVMRAGG
jgi:hypothetical protein